MKILFLTDHRTEYLQDSLFIGLREILGANVVDFPKKDILYKYFTDLKKLRGFGMTLYGVLDDIDVDRNNALERAFEGEFDLIIFGCVHRLRNIIRSNYKLLKNQNLVFLDGQDQPCPFKYCGSYLRKTFFKYIFFPNLWKKHIYFKRELYLDTLDYIYFKILPKFILEKLDFPKNIYPISYSFPTFKIRKHTLPKKQLFQSHIVDNEVSQKFGKKTNYVFDNEQEYYYDLAISKFGITTKRSGWDALRHYEIAANHTVLAFRDLDKKPQTCAPHGLNESNTIIYHNYDELMFKVNNLSDSQYQKMLKNTINWIYEYSTKSVAQKFLDTVIKFYNLKNDAS